MVSSDIPSLAGAARATRTGGLAQIEALFAALGDRAYSGEPVTQLEHALQSAALAQADGAAEPLVAAALLHDLGHLVNDLGESPTVHGVDDLHQFHGAHWLKPLFGPEVLEPIRLHVLAKRYLCATRAGYLEALSADSVRSLALQGGPLDAEAAAAFLARPYALDAVRLRLWDDAAKVAGQATPTLADYRALLARCLRPVAAGAAA
jgi:phosphonate degradation associated HDIG domain protein